ncbi:PepSY-associated TM helix domain-containing protein [Pseudoalteromonas sp. NC201]|uniref:PepSY-associated TM helix domain-containing protein n=1 Tax=Pseudoalteromonas sp. NC201 TaxID=1514074 RepID=UPI000CA33ED4|nr:PepSY-associated TM helix domain-containing protein [Pseudoalteromonas sp. NC201]AUJ71038.1 hypothetical protein PNC201_13895 [Pseudoalteromonas sp. NC201]
MKARFRQSMSWLHTWTGVVFAWMLYFIFVTGSVGYFENEIDRWMKPEIMVSKGLEDSAITNIATRQLSIHGDNASQWYISFPTSRDPFIEISWLEPDNTESKTPKQWHESSLDPVMGTLIRNRQTSGGEALYRLHYNLHYVPQLVGYILTSIAAMIMLIGLVTGLIIHKKIFAEFFTFRAQKGLRSWLDIHNIFSVLPLPFHLMITYSGLLLLMGITMSPVIDLRYGEGQQNHRQFYVQSQTEQKSQQIIEMLPTELSVQSALADAKRRFKSHKVSYVGVIERNTEKEHIEIWFESKSGIEFASLLEYRAIEDKVMLETSLGKAGGAASVYDFLEHLHEGLFADIYLRWIYFLSGLFGAAMVATGLMIWLKKRKAVTSTNKILTSIIERINIAMIIGVPIAIASYFAGNRLLPIGFPSRAAWEMHILFITLGLCILYCGLASKKWLWQRMLCCAALVYGLLPILNALTTEHNIWLSWINSDWLMVGFDLTVLFISICFVAAFWVVRCRQEGISVKAAQ